MTERITCPNGHPLKVARPDLLQTSFRFTCPVCNTLSLHQPKPAEEVPATFVPPEAPSGSTLSHSGDELNPNETRVPGDRVEDADALTSSLPSISGYDVEGELGRGGMGVVYKARQRGLNRLVALKMIRSASLAGAQERARFRTEAKAVARLQHPHVVQIHEIGEHDGQPFFSLEYVDGGSLAQKLDGMPQPPH